MAGKPLLKNQIVGCVINSMDISILVECPICGEEKFSTGYLAVYDLEFTSNLINDDFDGIVPMVCEKCHDVAVGLFGRVVVEGALYDGDLEFYAEAAKSAHTIQKMFECPEL